MRRYYVTFLLFFWDLFGGHSGSSVGSSCNITPLHFILPATSLWNLHSSSGYAAL